MADDDIKLTEYGGSVPGDQPGGPTYDPNSYSGIGDRDNKLVTGYSVALTPDERLARFGTTGPSTGREFEYQGKTYRDDDTAAQYYRGRDEGKRIDVYQGGGAAQALGRVRSEGTLGPENLLATSGGYSESEPDIAASTPLDLRFDTTEEEAQVINNESPYDAWKRNNPILADAVPKSKVIDDMHQSIAPEMDPAKFRVLAQAPAGYQAIKNIQAGVTPLQQWRKDHPEFAFYSDEDITRDTYNKMVSQKRLDPKIWDYDAFKMTFNPPNPILANTFHFLKGFSEQGYVSGDVIRRQFWESPEMLGRALKDLLNQPYDVLKGVGLQGVMTEGEGTTIAKNIDGWLNTNQGKPVHDLWQKVDGWLKDRQQAEIKQTQIDQERADIAGGGTGVGKFGQTLGGAAIDIGGRLPIYEALGGPAAAVVVADTYLGLNAYGDAVQAHEDNAFLKGVESAFTNLGFGYMMRSPIGRIKTAAVTFAVNSGRDQLEKMLKGEPSDWSQFAQHSFVDIGLSVIFGKSAEKGPYARYAAGPSLEDLYYEHKTRPENPVWQVHVPQNGGLPPAAHEAMLDALDARARGDYKGAAEHLDKAMSILSPKDRQDVAQRVIASVKSEEQPTSEAQKQHDDHYFGIPDAKVPQGTIEGFENEDFGPTVEIDETGKPEEHIARGEDQTVSAEPAGVSEKPTGTSLTSALDDLRGDEKTGGSALPAGQGETKTPAERLFSWAERNGKVLNLRDLRDRVRDFFIKNGSFHRVYRHPDDPGRVIKTRVFDTDPAYDDIQDQLQHYEGMNKAFGSDINLEGIAIDEGGPDSNVRSGGSSLIEPQGQAIVTSMPHIEEAAEPPSDDKMEKLISEFMKSHGFKESGYGRWENQKLKLWADDASTGNFIFGTDGKVHPVDLQMGPLKEAEEEFVGPPKREGPVSQAQRARIDPAFWLRMFKDTELDEEIQRYREDPNKRAQWELAVKEKARRRAQRGEGGFIVIPGADRIKRWFEAGLEPFKRLEEWRREEFDPENVFGQGAARGAARAANIARRENVKAALAEDLQQYLHLNHQVDEALRGAQPIMRRRHEFQQFSNDQLKQYLIAFEEGKNPKVPKAKQQKMFDNIFNFHRIAYKAMAEIEHRIADFGYKIRDNYIYHAIRDKDRDRFESWLHNWQKNKPGWHADPRFSKARDLPTLREVFAAGYELKSYNPEDLFQMRLNAHTEAIKQIRIFRQIKDIGLAFLKNPKEKDIQARMQETGMNYEDAKKSFKIPDDILHGKEWVDGFRSPNGEQYVVEKNAALLLNNIFDKSSFFTSKNLPLRWYFKGMSAAKGMSSQLVLALSLYHPKHIGFTSLVNYSWDWMKAAATGKPWSVAEAWENAIKLLPTTAIPELDYFQNRRSITSLNQDELARVDAIRWMGLNFGINAERAMQWNFAAKIAEEFPRLRSTLHPANKMAMFGYRWLLLQPVQEWIFGRMIPQQKIADALRDHAQLMKDHPEYLEPENAEEYHTQLGAIGKAIEAKYGEMFLDNLFWKKTTKEIFTTHLLSLGWQLSALRVYGGGVQDLLDNSLALAGLREKTNNPKVMGLISDRMGHLGMYLGMYMLTNAAISWVNAYSKGKSFETKDLWFPVIGQNPKGSRDPWIRAAPGEFNRELAVWYMHTMASGAPLLSGTPLENVPVLRSIPGIMATAKGTFNYAANKLQPVASSMKQAFIDQKNYFGADIGGEPTDTDLESIASKLEYVLANSGIPIPVKTQIQAKPGVSGSQGPWPMIWSVFGYPQAGAYVGRSDVQNLIVSEYSVAFPSGAKIQDQIDKKDAYDQYRMALQTKDHEAIHAAVDHIRQLAKEQHFDANKAIESVRTNALKGLTSDQYMFKRLPYETQIKILRLATPEEQEEYKKFMHR